MATAAKLQKRRQPETLEAIFDIPSPPPRRSPPVRPFPAQTPHRTKARLPQISSKKSFGNLKAPGPGGSRSNSSGRPQRRHNGNNVTSTHDRAILAPTSSNPVPDPAVNTRSLQKPGKPPLSPPPTPSQLPTMAGSGSKTARRRSFNPAVDDSDISTSTSSTSRSGSDVKKGTSEFRKSLQRLEKKAPKLLSNGATTGKKRTTDRPPTRRRKVLFATPAVSDTVEVPFYDRRGYQKCNRRAHGCKVCTCCRCTEKKEKVAIEPTEEETKTVDSKGRPVPCLCRACVSEKPWLMPLRREKLKAARVKLGLSQKGGAALKKACLSSVHLPLAMEIDDDNDDDSNGDGNNDVPEGEVDIEPDDRRDEKPLPTPPAEPPKRTAPTPVPAPGPGKQAQEAPMPKSDQERKSPVSSETAPRVERQALPTHQPHPRHDKRSPEPAKVHPVAHLPPKPRPTHEPPPPASENRAEGQSRTRPREPSPLVTSSKPQPKRTKQEPARLSSRETSRETSRERAREPTRESVRELSRPPTRHSTRPPPPPHREIRRPRRHIHLFPHSNSRSDPMLGISMLETLFLGDIV